ncbi:MAG: tyrosine-type recombinase/integrase [Gaiellaceae bacterium]
MAIVKRRSRKYAIVYRVNGRQVWETIGPSKREAERAERERRRAADRGEWIAPSRVTLEQYGREWLSLRDPGRVAANGRRRARTRLETSTFDQYAGVLERHVFPRLGGRQLASLRTTDVDALIHSLEANGKSPGTVRNVIVPLRKMLADAVRQGLLIANPASNADLPPAQDFVGQEIPSEHTEAIREALAELARPDPLRDGEPDLLFAYLFDVALGTGLRLGELRGLRWSDVDFERTLIRVEQAYSRRTLKRPKTDAGIRSVPLFPSAEAAMRELAARAFTRGRFADDQLVFTTERGTPLDGSNFNHLVWSKALQLAGLGDWTVDGQGKRRWKNRYRFHDLRHTAVSRLVAEGADVRLVQAVAGHSKASLTLDRYTHLTDERVREAAKRFDPARKR